MELPYELLRQVVQHLSRRDLKQLRSTCRQLAEQIVPFLFDSVFLSTDPYDLEQAERAIISYRQQIRSVLVSVVAYNELTRLDYYKKVRLQRKKGSFHLPPHSRFDQHMQHNYKRYCTLQNKSAQPGCTSKLEELLRMVINTAPQISTITITPRSRFNELELANCCRWKTCPLPPEAHAMFRIMPLHSYKKIKFLDLSPLLLIIGSSGATGLRAMVMDSFPFFQISNGTFGRLEGRISQVSAFLANLAKLRLTLDYRHIEQTRLARPGAVARFLSQARNLECLYLENFSHRSDIYPTEPNRLRDLGVCQLPKLRVLILRQGEMSGDEILRSLKTLPRLKHLVLEYCALEGYLWKVLIEKIKMQHHLESLRLCFIRGYALLEWPYVDYCGEVKRYLVGDGPNPFSKEELAKTVLKRSKFVELTGDSDPSFAEECYQRHF
ncbi:MAG: hypothetical protein Q9191_001712 [Dirinaria sp. TL-2023a]